MSTSLLLTCGRQNSYHFRSSTEENIPRFYRPFVKWSLLNCQLSRWQKEPGVPTAGRTLANYGTQRLGDGAARYIGEGFDEPRLDTLFLTMPISWKGTLQQYAGRLHRLFAEKREVQIYDYVDIHVNMLEKMYHKRLNGYASIGYMAKAGAVEADSIDVIFDKSNFLPVYNNDILASEREILIVSPFVTKRRTLQMMQQLEIALRNKVRVIVVTRPPGDFGEKNQSPCNRLWICYNMLV